MEQVESEEGEWVVAEGVDVIDRGTEGMDAAQKVVYRKKVQMAWGEGLRRKLEGGEEGAAPGGRGEVARVEGERRVGGRRKDKEGEKLAKESARKKPENKTIAEEKEKSKAVAEIREATKELVPELELVHELALEKASREMEQEETLSSSSPQHPGYSPPHLALALAPFAILILAAILFAMVGKGNFGTRRRLFEVSCYLPYYVIIFFLSGEQS